MWLLKLDSVSTNYRGSDCVMLELCNSLILPSLILFILILHSILGIKILSRSNFFLFSSTEIEIYRHELVSDFKLTFFPPNFAFRMDYMVFSSTGLIFLSGLLYLFLLDYSFLALPANN